MAKNTQERWRAVRGRLLHRGVRRLRRCRRLRGRGPDVLKRVRFVCADLRVPRLEQLRGIRLDLRQTAAIQVYPISESFQQD